MTKSNLRTGGELLIDALINEGIDTVFCVPGESYLAALDAMWSRREKITPIVCRQEGGAGFMAEAHGKLTGKPGVCFVTRGPGAANASIAVHSAKQASTPMILFVGQVGRDCIGREAFQEVDYRQTFCDLAKWTTQIDDTARVPEIVARAVHVAKSGRPGPVVVALPEDMLTERSDVADYGPVPIVHAGVDADTLAGLGKALGEAERPIILMGGGGWTAKGRDDLQAFAEANDVPVCVSFRRQDLFDNAHRCYAGDVGLALSPVLKQALQDSDLILAVNARFGEITTQTYTLFDVPAPAQRIVHVHAGADEFGKVYKADQTIACEPNAFAAALTGLTLKADQTRRARVDQLHEAHMALFDAPKQPGNVDMVEVTRAVQRHAGDGFIVTNGAGNFATWANKFIQFPAGSRLLAPQSGAMGYGVPAGVAAAITHRDRTVVTFAGDGDFLMNGQELATAAQYDATPIVLIVNNGTYGTIRMHQERHYPGRVVGTDLANPDFVMLARAYGFEAKRVEHTEDFEPAFAQAVKSGRGWVFDLDVSAEAITPRQTLSAIREKALEAVPAE